MIAIHLLGCDLANFAAMVIDDIDIRDMQYFAKTIFSKNLLEHCNFLLNSVSNTHPALEAKLPMFIKAPMKLAKLGKPNLQGLTSLVGLSVIGVATLHQLMKSRVGTIVDPLPLTAEASFIHPIIASRLLEASGLQSLCLSNSDVYQRFLKQTLADAAKRWQTRADVKVDLQLVQLGGNSEEEERGSDSGFGIEQ